MKAMKLSFTPYFQGFSLFMFLLAALAPAAGPASEQAQPAATGAPKAGLLKPNDRVAIVGDSITEQKIYSRFIETYLLACLPQLNLRTIQLGWSGEAAPGILARLDNDLLPWKPNVATLCYGMNDGSYQPYDAEIGRRFESNLQQVVAKLKAAGATVVVGSPGIVDPAYFPPEFLKRFGKNVDGKTYNENLARLRDTARALAARAGFPFANVYDPMLEVMGKFKAAYGPKAIFAGNDGVHPWDDGHLVMAYAFLKAMGLDGDLGTITVDMKGEAAGATAGHRIRSAAPGKVEVESSRYPFCFAKVNGSDGGTSWSARAVLPCFGFNQDLNRLTLRVKGLASESATVNWGGCARRFTRPQLEAGINLAAEFLDNPFSEPFARLDKAVQKKEAFETFMIKQVVTQFRSLPGDLARDAGARRALDEARAALEAEDARLHEAARKTIVPVVHTITVE
jgi:lysophospholipase L1-like esterase